MNMVSYIEKKIKKIIVNKKIDILDKIIIGASLLGTVLVVLCAFIDLMGWWGLIPTMFVLLVGVETFYKIKDL